MQVFLPPEGLTNFGEASSTQDSVFCAQLQRLQIKSMNERGLHSWHAENCYKKFPFLCKRSTHPFFIITCFTNPQLSVDATFPSNRTNLRRHKGQRGERGLLLHTKGGRPVSELHVSWRRARDVRGSAVRASAGLSALPERSKRVLQVYLLGPRQEKQGD